MPWHKQFDEHAALERAMEAFWARGYAATSVEDLVAAMGLHRGSIYAAFGGKRRLFLKALEHYEVRWRRAWLADLSARLGPRAAILAVFDGAIAAALSEGAPRGCFLVNTAVELSPHDQDVCEAVARGLAETETFFRETIAAGQDQGEIPPAVDPECAGAALLGLLTGLRVLARSRPEPPLLQALSDQAERLLEG